MKKFIVTTEDGSTYVVTAQDLSSAKRIFTQLYRTKYIVSIVKKED